VFKRRRINEDIIILKKNLNIIYNGIFGFSNNIQVETAVGFAFYLNSVGITAVNYQLFLKLLETNNRYIVDALIGSRDPKLLFSTIKPNKYLIKKAFKLLTSWHPDEIYDKSLLAALGIIECAYYKPDDGYKIYRLKIQDLNNVGKFLDSKKDQLEERNRALLDVLDKIAHIGEYGYNFIKNTLSKHAFNIRFGFFDNKKNLEDVVPQVLLIRIDRKEREVLPSKEYLNFFNSRKKV